MQHAIKRLGLVLMLFAASAQAQLFTNDFGAPLAGPSNCDDCFEGPLAFTGASQSIEFFGQTYGDLFVSSNGYITFGAGGTSYSSRPLDSQTIGPMIAGLFTDLDGRPAISTVYLNNSTPGQLIATWETMSHFSQNTTVASTFQLVVRSDQFAVPAGQGQIGFFWGEITDSDLASAGFGDGEAAINPGEVALFSGPGTGLSNAAFRWETLGAGGVPVDPTRPVGPEAIPVSPLWALGLMTAMLALLGSSSLRTRARG